MKFLRLITLGFMFAIGSVHAAGFDEGIEYEKIKPPVGKQSSGKKIEVVELFWYGCPHCFQFEPHLHKWLKKKPANVEFIRVPATFRPVWKLHARMYYTVELLGLTDKLHQKIFDAYHVGRNRLGTEKEIRKFFIANGVKGEDFDNTFASFAVDTKVRRAEDLTRRYGISGVPSMIVNGKYRTSNKISGHSTMLEVIDYLIKKQK